MSENYLRELLEGALSGELSLDEVRAELWAYDKERVAHEDMRWWVWCKDHASSYPTERQAITVRDAIEKLTLDRPNLGCHNTHLIMQSETDPRPKPKSMWGDLPEWKYTKDETIAMFNEAQLKQYQASDDLDSDLPHEPPEQICWWCDMPLGVNVTPIRVWQADVGWGSVFIHSTSDKPECWQEWRKASGYGEGVGVRTDMPPQPTDTTDEVEGFIPQPAKGGPRSGICVQCGHNIWTSSVEPTRWWDLFEGRKRYTCHPSDDVAHSEHRIDTPMRTD